MTYLEGILLGLVQGLGEFLPISSSAHLIVAPWLFGFKDAGLGYSVALHLGTLLAVLIYFAKDWWQLTASSIAYVCKRQELHKKYFWEMVYLILATLPAAVAGIFLDDFAETIFRAPWIPAITMTVLGILLWQADNRAAKNSEQPTNMTLTMAMLIGCAQAMALLPGVSRSGITITIALFLGLSRTQAARFSFLLSTPIILGACVLKLSDVQLAFTYPPAMVGLITSAVIGFLSIKYLMQWIKVSSYKVFSLYRFAFTAVVVVAYIVKAII